MAYIYSCSHVQCNSYVSRWEHALPNGKILIVLNIFFSLLIPCLLRREPQRPWLVMFCFVLSGCINAGVLGVRGTESPWTPCGFLASNRREFKHKTAQSLKWKSLLVKQWDIEWATPQAVKPPLTGIFYFYWDSFNQGVEYSVRGRNIQDFPRERGDFLEALH